MSADVYLIGRDEFDTEIGLHRQIRYALECHWDQAIRGDQWFTLTERHIPLLESVKMRHPEATADVDRVLAEIRHNDAAMMIAHY